MGEKYIELNTFVKIKGLASTGGQAKILIRAGVVLVNGQIEMKNKRKLHSSDKVSYKDKDFIVEEEVCKME